MGNVSVGTESIFDSGFYCFPYIGRVYNQGGNQWLGNAFMISNPEMEPAWFVLKEENKSNDAKEVSYKRVIKTIQDKKIMVDTRDDGIYIRLAGNECDGYAFADEFVNAYPFGKPDWEVHYKTKFDGAKTKTPLLDEELKWPSPKKEIDVDKPLNISMREIASCITNVVKQNIHLPHDEATFIDWRKLDEIIKSKL